MIFKWFPWRFILRHAARRHGFLDPFSLIARLQNFAQPAEVAAPLELVRAGAVFHARGLVNSQAIQHNLDWVWPYWVECQFNPKDPAFIPRAFNITHVNLTHRNWTAIGVPDSRELPIVDPRGLVTPFFDGWSVDAWFIPATGAPLIPSREVNVRQDLIFDPLSVVTTCKRDADCLKTRVQLELDQDVKNCVISVTGQTKDPGFLVLSIRPYNPEGVSFIDTITLCQHKAGLEVNEHEYVLFSERPDHVRMNAYTRGDVFADIRETDRADDTKIRCKVGMATAAALFRLTQDETKTIEVTIPLKKNWQGSRHSTGSPQASQKNWDAVTRKTTPLVVPDQKMQFLYDAAIRTIILHSNNDVYPGPYTYKRFWFRDAAFILDALLKIGLHERVKPIIEQFPQKQTPLGYFLSQEGEWDANGEALWILNNYYSLSDDTPSQAIVKAVIKGAKWIMRKRLSKDKERPHAGLFPPGFSAEHLGPNDYYYWDDFWGVAGLKAAANIMRRIERNTEAILFENEAKDFMKAIERSLDLTREKLKTAAIPASPYRRLDGGAVGSLVASYPLSLFGKDDMRIKKTLDYLYESCLIKGAFFHDLTHSGINAYLTLHMAQAYLRAGNDRYFDLVKAVADYASPTGQWPEAIHPITRGGCMGDGQHVWAAAEWVMMIRNMFVREEGDKLMLCSGIPKEWFAIKHKMSFGPTRTLHGDVSVDIDCGDEITISWSIEHDKRDHDICLRLPNGITKNVTGNESSVQIKKEELL